MAKKKKDKVAKSVETVSTPDISEISKKNNQEIHRIYDDYLYCDTCGCLNYVENRYCTRCGLPLIDDFDDLLYYDTDDNEFESNNDYLNNRTYIPKPVNAKPIIALLSVLFLVGVLITICTPHSINYIGAEGTNNSNPTQYRFIDEKIKLQNLDKKGYKFEGWYKDADYKNRTEIIDTKQINDIKLYAKWSEIEYLIRYQLNGGTVTGSKPEKYTINSGIIQLPTPVRDNYDFVGWRTDSGDIINSLNSQLLKNVTLNAEWKARVYKITYRNISGIDNSYNPTQFTVEDTIVLSSPGPKDGYEFKGWYTDMSFNERVEYIENRKQNLVLYAKWELIKYYVHYMDDGEIGTSEFTINSTVYISKSTSKQGYKFLGWSQNGQDIIKQLPRGTDYDVYVYAMYEPITYRISYSGVNGAINNNPSSYTADDNGGYLYPLERTGYIFEGWYDENGNKVECIQNWNRNIRLTARWTRG